MLTAIPSGAVPGLTLMAWATFSYAGALTVHKTFNVSGIVRNALGDYTLSFSNALAGTDYVADFVTDNSQGLYGVLITRNTGSARVQFFVPGASTNDPMIAYVAIYR